MSSSRTLPAQLDDILDAELEARHGLFEDIVTSRSQIVPDSSWRMAVNLSIDHNNDSKVEEKNNDTSNEEKDDTSSKGENNDDSPNKENEDNASIVEDTEDNSSNVMEYAENATKKDEHAENASDIDEESTGNDGQPNFECNHCSLSNDRAAILLQHKVKFHPYVACNVCRERFIDVTRLQEHILTDDCMKSDAVNEAIKMHLQLLRLY